VKSVAICVPRFGGLIHGKTADAIHLAASELDKRGDHVELHYIDHESLIPRARNLLCHLFLKSKCERMVFVDADILFHASALIALVDRPEDVVGAVYPRKCINWRNVRRAVDRGEEHPQRFAADFVVNMLAPDGPGEYRATVRDGCLVEVEALPTGFLSLSREALMRMAEAHPETIYVDDGERHGGDALYALFDGGIVGERYLSEDYLFCHRWRALGGQCWLHIGIALGHIGQHTYAGDLHTVFQPIYTEAS
jgi:hypothetical protein